MKKKNEKQMTAKEVCSVTLRGFRMLYRMQPKAILTSVILAIWSALTPYVGISFPHRSLMNWQADEIRKDCGRWFS